MRQASGLRAIQTSTTAAIVALLGTGLGPAAAAAQDPHAGHVMAAPETPTTSTEHIRVIDDPDQKELTVIVGPIDLPAHSSHHMEQLPVQEGTVPFDMTIRSYRTEIIDKDGRDVPRVVLHHMNLLDPNRRELFLPIMLRVLAASHETPPISLPGWLFGIPMHGGSNFWALAMLHNPTDETYEGVEVRLIIGYERAEVLPMYTMSPFHIDTMYPTVSTKAFDLPPGRSSKSWQGSPAIGGLIVGLGGHMHAYASRLTLEDLTTGEIIYDVRPKLDEDGQLLDIPLATHRGKGLGKPVFPNHVYRVTAEYFNPHDIVIEAGGMGSIAGGFIPFDDWPHANPAEPLFAADYDWVLRSQFEHGSGGHDHSVPSGDEQPGTQNGGSR